LIEQFVLKMKRGDNAFYRALMRMLKGALHSRFPVPRLLYPLLRMLYAGHFAFRYALRWAANYFYREPLFRSRCEAIGKNFHLWLMPEVSGHTRITIGDGVSFFGFVGITSGRVFDDPRLVIGNGVDIGHNVSIVVNKEVIIEDDVNIASGVRIMDTDAHPRDPELRAMNLPPGEDEIKPIRICRRAWIGQNAFILKGVTIGEAAVVGVNSVVVNDIPAHTVAIGNPARVVMKNIPKDRALATTSAEVQARS
jgi:acetyltransferase-like isoleucine patch superfamily enzyme